MSITLNLYSTHGFLFVEEAGPTGGHKINNTSKPVADKPNTISTQQGYFFQTEKGDFVNDLELVINDSRIIDTQRSIQPKYIEITAFSDTYHQPTSVIEFTGNLATNSNYTQTVNIINKAGEVIILPVHFIAKDNVIEILINGELIKDGKYNNGQIEINFKKLNITSSDTNINAKIDGTKMQNFIGLTTEIDGTVFACYQYDAKVPLAKLNFYRCPVPNKMSYQDNKTFKETIDSEQCIQTTGNLGVPGMLIKPDLSLVEKGIQYEKQTIKIEEQLDQVRNPGMPHNASYTRYRY